MEKIVVYRILSVVRESATAKHDHKPIQERGNGCRDEHSSAEVDSIDHQCHLVDEEPVDVV